MNLQAIPHGLIGNWSPGIGDPSFVGWFTTFAYFATAALCLRAAKRTPRSDRREHTIWLVLAMLFVMLGVNKQLDLQSALTELGRISARRSGWYERRAHVQRLFIAAICIIAAVASALGVFVTWRASREARIAIIGGVVIAAFVAIRAASFHHVDALLNARWFALRGNWVLELSGISITAFASAARGRLRKSSNASKGRRSY